MTAISVGEELLQAIAPDRPCGDDLEDTALLASFDTYRVFGQSAPHEPAPEWSVIRAKAAEALCKSKDLRLLAHLASAVLRIDGLPAFGETLTIASRWLETYWRDTYPRIDEDGIFRRNALNYFADPIAIVDGVRRAPLIRSAQHGTYSLRDIEIAAGLVPADGKSPPEQARIDAAMAAASREDLTRLHETVVGGLAALTRIDARMTEDGVNAAPSFQPLSSQLAKIDRLLRKHLAVEAGDAVAPAAGDGVAQQVETRGAAVGVIRTREDAIRALDAVADFFRRHEPSSPIPLFVDRAKRLVSKDFLEVLADIAPGAVPEAKSAGGIRD